MAALDIQLNSFRQMLYNNYGGTGHGYLNNEAQLSPLQLADYHKIQPDDFRVEKELNRAWHEWAENDEKIQAILQRKPVKSTLDQLANGFKEYFRDVYPSHQLARPLTRSLFYTNILEHLKQKWGETAIPNEVSIIKAYLAYLKTRLTREWDNGELGLIHTLSIVDSCAEAISTCRGSLADLLQDMQEGGILETPILEQLNQRQKKWEKLPKKAEKSQENA